jgi:hypothetical protein
MIDLVLATHHESRDEAAREDEPATWWNGGTGLPPSNLDPVVAVEHMRFTDFDGAEVTVLGWPKPVISLPSGGHQRARVQFATGYRWAEATMGGDS